MTVMLWNVYVTFSNNEDSTKMTVVFPLDRVIGLGLNNTSDDNGNGDILDYAYGQLKKDLSNSPNDKLNDDQIILFWTLVSLKIY